MSMKKPKGFSDIKAEINMRLDGIFDELGAALSEAAARFEEGGGTVRRSRTYQTKQGPIHAEAGVNVHLAGDFASIKSTGRSPSDQQEPLQDIDASENEPAKESFEIDAEIVHGEQSWTLLATLPKESAVGYNFSLTNSHLVLKIFTENQDFSGNFPVPESASLEKIEIYKNDNLLKFEYKNPV